MTRQERFNVILVGAGEINFGSVEGPWNHSIRLEQILGERLDIICLIDPDQEKARARVATKRDAHIPGWECTSICSSISDALVKCQLQNKRIDLCILGVPPHFRGSAHSPADLDLTLLESIPQTKHWLVEKPISALQPTLANGQFAVLQAYAGTDGVVGVGYHLTALKIVTKLQELLKERGMRVMATQARYNMAYGYAAKPSWWNKTISCGPIVEQATHLASLSLLFGGSAHLPSVRTHTVEPFDPPGELSSLGIDESTIPPESRIPRYTSAVWKYKGGAVGSLSHSVALWGMTYDTEFEVITDGAIYKLVDLYSKSPKLLVRRDGNAEQETICFENDDPYKTQIEALLQGQPKCTYQQALETYELTWAIRLAGEKERAESQAA